jgi:outer membrane protein OmpA-like peptidoglycan-associated protein
MMHTTHLTRLTRRIHLQAAAYATSIAVVGIVGIVVVTGIIITSMATVTRPLHAQDDPPQKPEIKAVGVEANGVERPVVQIRVDEYLSRNIHPLLNYIFFDDNSDKMPSRYTSLSDTQTDTFTPNRLFGVTTMEVYYTMLNVLGYRLKNQPDAKITLIGCNSNTGVEKGNQTLSTRRAETVKAYLTSIWKIDPARISIQARDLPLNPSSSKDSPGDSDAENRRVEIQASWDIAQPLVISDTLREATPPTIRFYSKAYGSATPSQNSIKVEQRGQKVNTISKSGAVRPVTDWRINKDKNTIPLDTVPITYRLEVDYDSSMNQKSNRQSMPVEQITVQKKRRERVNDIEKDRYSMILFDFGKSTLGEFNTRIAQIIKDDKRITTKSKVTIIGSTDLIGTAEANKRISEERAKAVAAALNVSKTTVKEFSVLGKGKEQPLAFENEYPEGRFYCRTVVVDVENPVEFDN